MVQEKNKASSFCFDCLIPHVRNNIGGGGGHSAVVVLLRHQNVAVIAPERRPGVLHKPVVTVSVISSISNNKDGMVFISAPVYLLQVDLMFQTD